jgi:hypothetical protein
MFLVQLLPLDSKRIFSHPLYSLNDSRVRLGYDKASVRASLQVTVDFKGRKLIMQPLVGGYYGIGEYLVGCVGAHEYTLEYCALLSFANWQEYTFFRSLKEEFLSRVSLFKLPLEVKDRLCNYFDKEYIERSQYYSARLDSFARLLFFDTADYARQEYLSVQYFRSIIVSVYSGNFSSEDRRVFYRPFFNYVSLDNSKGDFLTDFYKSFFTYFLKDCQRFSPDAYSWWLEIEKDVKANGEEGYVLYFLLGAMLESWERGRQ